MAKKLGRPRRLELQPEIQQELIHSLQAGNYLDVACTIAGINRQLCYKWMRWGASEKTGIYRDFRDAIEKAIAQAEAHDIATIGLDASWQSKAWRLERKHPERWGVRVRLTVENELNEFVSKLKKVLTPAEFRRVAEAIAAADIPALLGPGEPDSGKSEAGRAEEEVEP